jgi:hypothetical protein
MNGNEGANWWKIVTRLHNLAQKLLSLTLQKLVTYEVQVFVFTVDVSWWRGEKSKHK